MRKYIQDYTTIPKNNHLKVTKYANLKHPKFKWVFYNTLGGSFSPSIEFNSLTLCLQNFLKGKDNYNNILDLDLLIETVHSYDMNNKATLTHKDTSIRKEIEQSNMLGN